MKRQKKTLLVFMAVLMAALLVACSTSSPTAQPTAKPDSTPATTSATADATMPASAVDTSPITMTIGLEIDSMTLGDGIHDDYIDLQEVTKKTGVTINWITYDTQKFDVLAAGGDLPEIFELLDKGTYPNLMSSGALLALDELLQKYGQNIQKNMPLALKWAKEIAGQGKTYVLPIGLDHATYENPVLSDGAGGGFTSRYDIWKEVGSPAITDEASFLAALKQMQDSQRTKTGQTDIYAFSAWADWGLFPYTHYYTIANGYYPTVPCLISADTGEVSSAYLDPKSSFWQGIQFYNKAYQLGLFDPQGMTQKYDQYSTAIQNGKILSTDLVWMQPDAKVCGENSVMAILPGSQKYGKVESISSIGFGVERCRAVSSNCKNPERAVQLLDWFESVEGARIVANGVQGQQWDIVDGKPQLIGDYKQAVLDGTAADYKKSHKLSQGMDRLISKFENVEAVTGELIDLSQSPEIKAQSASAGMKSFAKDFGFEYPGQVYADWLKSGKMKAWPADQLAYSLMEPLSDTSANIEKQVETYFMANVSKVIMAKTDAEYLTAQADIIKAFEGMGLVNAENEWKTNYKAAQDKVSSFS